MAGYWPSSCFACLWTETDRASLGYGIKHQSMICVLAGQSPYPERARNLHLARSGSQSQREIRFILPAHGVRHVINCDIIIIIHS